MSDELIKRLNEADRRRHLGVREGRNAAIKAYSPMQEDRKTSRGEESKG